LRRPVVLAVVVVAMPATASAAASYSHRGRTSQNRALSFRYRQDAHGASLPSFQIAWDARCANKTRFRGTTRITAIPVKHNRWFLRIRYSNPLPRRQSARILVTVRGVLAKRGARGSGTWTASVRIRSPRIKVLTRCGTGAVSWHSRRVR
jgi:hypothetical protein